MPTTPNFQLPYPVLGDTSDVPRDITNLALALDHMVVPIGAVMMWITSTMPNDRWILLDGDPGNVVTSAAYPGLVAIFGATAGIINVPDLSGRMLVMAGSLPASSPPTTAVLKSTGGASAVTLSGAQSGVPVHAHPDDLSTSVDGSHSHSMLGMNRNWSHHHDSQKGQTHLFNIGGGAISAAQSAGLFTTTPTTDTDTNHEHVINPSGSHGHTINGSVQNAAAANASQPHQNLPPYYAVNYIMRGR